MKTFFLAGQRSFGNRGCEALTRATSKILKENFGDVRIIVPSDNIPADSAQWPEHQDFGVEFIVVHEPFYAKIWKIVQALPLPYIKMAGWPFPFPDRIVSAIKESDAVLAIGGDNYSLDYFSLPNALMELDRIALRNKKIVMLWGASLGPFKVHRGFIDAMIDHLSKFSVLSIRETLSKQYAESVGLKKVQLVADSAFLLDDQNIEIKDFAPTSGKKGLVGINVSPMVASSRFRKTKGRSFSEEIVAFIEKLVAEGYVVLLVPHVIPHGDAPRNNDAHYMQTEILSALNVSGDKVKIAPSSLNAAQLKNVIGKCDYFIGARTHSTIAALSKGVPTISISYSQKSRGLNLDLFGHTDYTIPTAGLTADALMLKFNRIVEDAPAIKAALSQKLPEWKERARRLGKLLEEAMRVTNQ